MPVGAAIGVAGVAGAAATSSAARSTSRAATNTANQNNATQLQIYNQNRAMQQPYLTAGNTALNAWMGALGLGQGPQPGGTGTAVSPANDNRPGMGAGWQSRLGNLDGLADAFGRNALADQPALVSQGMPAVPDTGPQINPGPDLTSPGAPTPGVTHIGGGTPGAPPPGNALNPGYESYRNSLGYQTGLAAGERALNASLAAKGRLLSGDAMREGVRYNQDYNQTYVRSYYDDLYRGAMLGAGAANALSGVGTTYANAVSANNNNALNARANANATQGQAMSDLAGNLAGAYAWSQGNRGTSYGSTGSTGYGRPIMWG